MFSAEELQAAVQRSLANDIPPGKRGALVVTAALDGRGEVRYAYRVNGVWSLGAVLRIEKHAPPQGAVEIRATW